MKEQIDKTNILKLHSTESIVSISEPNIYYIYLLDNSASMSGAKFEYAKSGLIDLLEDTSVIEGDVFTFSQQIGIYGNVSKSLIKSQISNNLIGCTPLLKTLMNSVLNAYNKAKQKDTNCKIIINVFTDGADTEGGIKADKFKEMLDLIVADKNTFSIICDKNDKNTVIKLGIDESNILTHNNTASDIKDKMNITKTAFAKYRTNVKLGIDVTNNFYKNIQ